MIMGMTNQSDYSKLIDKSPCWNHYINELMAEIHSTVFSFQQRYSMLVFAPTNRKNISNVFTS